MLHELHHGIRDELKIQEQRALLVIKEVKINNQQMFKEDNKAMQDCEEVASHIR